MALIGKWTSGTVAALPPSSTTTFSDMPSTLFTNQVRNDSSEYTKSGSSITLDTSNTADGYLIRCSYETATTHNNRFTAQVQVVATSGASNATIQDSIAAGYSRNNTDNDMSADSYTVVTNITGSVTLTAQWRRQGSGSPAGSTTEAVLEIIPLYFDGIGMYEGTTNELLGGTTPTAATLDTTIAETGSSITRSGSSVTLAADKRYLVFGCYYSGERASTVRTQRWSGIGEDGTLLRDVMANTYIRDTLNDQTGEVFHSIIDTTGASKVIDMRVYRGDGVIPATLGGADVDGVIPTETEVDLTVIELKSGCEVFRSKDNTAVQNLGVAGDVVVDVARDQLFADSASWSSSNNTTYSAAVAMDAFIGSNVSASYNSDSGTRITRRFSLSKNGVADPTVSSTKFGRGNQGSQDTYGFSGNPFGFFSLAQNDTVGTIAQDIGATIAVSTRAGWVGFWGINIDTMNNSIITPTRRFFSIT